MERLAFEHRQRESGQEGVCCIWAFEFSSIAEEATQEPKTPVLRNVGLVTMGNVQAESGE